MMSRVLVVVVVLNNSCNFVSMANSDVDTSNMIPSVDLSSLVSGLQHVICTELHMGPWQSYIFGWSLKAALIMIVDRCSVSHYSLEAPTS